MSKRLRCLAVFAGLSLLFAGAAPKESLCDDCACKFYSADPVFVAQDARDLHGLAFARVAHARARGEPASPETEALLEEALRPLPGGWRRLGGSLLTRRAAPPAPSATKGAGE